MSTGRNQTLTLCNTNLQVFKDALDVNAFGDSTFTSWERKYVEVSFTIKRGGDNSDSPHGQEEVE